MKRKLIKKYLGGNPIRKYHYGIFPEGVQKEYKDWKTGKIILPGDYVLADDEEGN